MSVIAATMPMIPQTKKRAKPTSGNARREKHTLKTHCEVHRPCKKKNPVKYALLSRRMYYLYAVAKNVRHERRSDTRLATMFENDRNEDITICILLYMYIYIIILAANNATITIRQPVGDHYI